jgi:outer membrane protein assembly factor BamD
MNSRLSRAAWAVAFLVTVAGCSSSGDKLPIDNPFKSGKSERELRLEADGLYKLARRSLDTADFQGAIQRYDQILLRYPFTDYATQAQLESIYARYRAFDPEAALTTADRFLKEHPRHAAVDYVYYLKGLINFQRGESLFDWMMDSSRQDVGFARRAFDDFALLAQRYPNSRYAADARLRMVRLRNRIADHELSVVKYYVRRGAHVAAAKRAEKIIADYPGAPATGEALVLLEKSYREAGLNTLADEVKRVREANPDAGKPEPLAAAPAAAPAPAEIELQPGATVREITTDRPPEESPQSSPVPAKQE